MGRFFNTSKHQTRTASLSVKRSAQGHAKAVLLVSAIVLLACTHVLTVVAETLGAGVMLGSWSDNTASYFGASTQFVHADNARETVSSPPLRVLALMDWQSQRRTEFLSSWPNRSSVTLWANRDLATSLVASTRTASLQYRPVWASPSLPGGPSTVPDVVSAVGADLLGTGAASVLVQASDGRLYVMNHSSASAWTASAAFAPISITDSTNVTLTLKLPTVPQVSLVADFISERRPARAAEMAIVYVNAQDQLILLSHVPDAVWPPQYTPHLLLDAEGPSAQRTVLPLSLLSADVNEDCAAEVLYAVRDARQHLYEIFVLNSGSSFSSATAVSARGGSGTLLLQLREDTGEKYGDSFTLTDVDGDGLPELLLPVQLSSESSSCATADTSTGAETCTPYHAVRIFYPIRAAGVSGSPTCRASSSSSDHLLSYNVSRSEVLALTPAWCGVESWFSTSGTLPLYMPSYPSAPLLLRPGDYNRDRLVDLVVPSSYGPLLLTSRTARNARPLVCTALDATTGKAAVQQALTKSSAAPLLDAYRTATPFFASLGLLGRLEVVLTHHRRLPSSTTTVSQTSQIRVYQNSQVPSQSYFLSATALTMEPYGASCIGATHHMTWQDIHMQSHWATVTQQGRTQGHALLPQYVLVGLEETFSYVHDYTVSLRVSVGGTATVQSKEWPSYLVPNSRVFAELLPVDRPAKWNLELYLPTSRYRVLLVTALAIALVVIGLPVVWLRCGEMRQDYNEWRMP